MDEPKDDIDKLSEKYGQKSRNGKKLGVIITILVIILIIGAIYISYFGVPFISKQPKNETIEDYFFKTNKQWTSADLEAYFKGLCPNVTIDCGECQECQPCICQPSYNFSCAGGCPDCICNPDYTITAGNCSSCCPPCSSCVFDSCSRDVLRVKCREIQQIFILKRYVNGTWIEPDTMEWNSTDKKYYFTFGNESFILDVLS